MNPSVLIGTGLSMVIVGILVLIGLIESERQEADTVKADFEGREDCSAAQNTIIGQDGTILAPEGAFVWQATRGMYEVWERCINPGPLWTKDGYRWYELDKVGTPVTQEEQEKIKWQLYGYDGG